MAAVPNGSDTNTHDGGSDTKFHHNKDLEVASRSLNPPLFVVDGTK